MKKYIKIFFYGLLLIMILFLLRTYFLYNMFDKKLDNIINNVFLSSNTVELVSCKEISKDLLKMLIINNIYKNKYDKNVGQIIDYWNNFGCPNKIILSLIYSSKEISMENNKWLE